MPNIYQNENIFYNNPVPTQIFFPRTTTEPYTTITSTYDLSDRFRYQESDYVDSLTNNNLCLDGSFDAISLLSDGYTYVFKDAYVYKFDNNFVMDKEYPRLVNSVFKVLNYFKLDSIFKLKIFVVKFSNFSFFLN